MAQPKVDSIFVDPDARVEVWDEAEQNVIYVRQKMDIQTNALVKTELLRLRLNPDEMDEGQEISATIAVELQQVALLIHNIKQWEGPRFIHPATREVLAVNARHIRMLRPSDPHIRKVLQVIGENNLERTEQPPSSPPPPKPTDSNGLDGEGQEGADPN